MLSNVNLNCLFNKFNLINNESLMNIFLVIFVFIFVFKINSPLNIYTYNKKSKIKFYLLNVFNF